MIGALVALSLVVGALIGAVGIGGILLVPGLVVLGKLPIHAASATALFSFLFTGILSTWLYMRHGTLDVRASGWVCGGAIVSSFAGAYVNSLTDALVLARIIGSIIVLAGLNVLFPLRRPVVGGDGGRRNGLLLGVGIAAGFGSGLTGAGGPLFSVPIMLGLGFPPLMSIGVSQVLQVISSLSGTLGNLAYGSIDLHAALWIVPAQLFGVAIGVAIAHRANVAALRSAAGWLCVISGAFILLRGV
ncbi:MAG TPA: sulfite exporter TauE/SafE family protein [Casimicrobiaceae bacterium]